MDILHISAFLVPVYSFYFYRDMTSLVCLTVPLPPPANIYIFNGGRVVEGGRRERERRKAYYKFKFKYTGLLYYNWNFAQRRSIGS